MKSNPPLSIATIFLTLVGLATVPVPVVSQQPNPKGLTREQVAAIHGRIFNENEEVGAIPAALAKGSGDVYVYAVAYSVTGVGLDAKNQLANWMRRCDLVAVGTIGAGASYMTEGRGFLNTDWDFTVEEVLKNNSAAPLSPGETITVIRRGGKIKVEGRTVHAVQKMYKEFNTGYRYLLFLRFVPETGAYDTSWPMGFMFSGIRIVRLTSQHLHREIETMDEQSLKSMVKGIAAGGAN